MTAETDSPDPDPATSLLAFFGSELQRIRSEQNKSQGMLARRAHTSQSMISKIEAGRRVPSEDLARVLDRALDTGGTFERLQPIVIRYAYPPWIRALVELEAQSTAMRVFESQIIPGLLQTEDYARAMLAAVRSDDLEELVAARMSRQGILEREQPPRMWYVIDEQALQRPMGTPSMWRAQLRRLVKAGSHPRSVIQVIPRRVTAHPGLAGPFTLLSFEDHPDTMWVDGFSMGRITVDLGEVADGTQAYDLLRAAALSPDESADLITGYAEGRYS
ncbi:helix-turn-helix domain-containing protein [Streptomyces sp. 8L]|uniref:helix-turn-helix domain-containing protein n=1 Tax=Streptomyces sp. 8L TaxID=2877242 RepID=UPI001CD7900F|nr:helix-turn-helix transcriptional regulator [Streptomyces sp. 8L]MCA1220457.1 helix-turn-helix transcriptional regulator [Streptomyces sp. 8L]